MNAVLSEQNKKLVLILAPLLVVLLLDYATFLGAQLRTFRRVSSKVAVSAQELIKAKSDTANEAGFQQRYGSVQDKMETVAKRILSDEEISLVLSEISLIAKEYRVKITQLKPLLDNQELALKTDQGAYYRLPIYIDASCGFHQFGMFLNKIEYSDIFMKTAEIEMTRDQKDVRNHQVRLVLNTFVIKK